MERFNNLPGLKTRCIALRKNYTNAELCLWLKLRYRQLGLKFRRQHSLGPYILDFYCPEKKLCIELDGGQHNSKEGKEYDRERSRYLNATGIKVVRFWNDEVLKNTKEVIEIIVDIITKTPS